MITSAPASSIAATDSLTARWFTSQGLVSLLINGALILISGPGVVEVDIPDGCAPVGKVVADHKVVIEHVMRLGKIDDAELVA